MKKLNLKKVHEDIEVDKMDLETIKKELKSKECVEVNAKWLENKDPELLDWVVSSKYWGRGYDYTPKRESAVVRIYFKEDGIAYIATHNNIDVEQSLNNQPYWDWDLWSDWTYEQLLVYYNKIK